MKRSVSSAPRADATGAATAPHSGATALTTISNNSQNQQQSQSSAIRAHESPPITTQSTVTTYLPHATQIHTPNSTTTLHPNSSGTAQSVVHISSANLNQIIRPIGATNLTSANPTTIHTIGSNVGINLSALGTPVSGQITIPASAVSAATNQLAHNAQTGATNLILHRQPAQNNQQNQHSNIATTGSAAVGHSAPASGTTGTVSTHRFSTVIPTSLHLNKVSGNIANINQITVSQATAAQIQIAAGTNVANHNSTAVTQGQAVSLGGHQVAPGASVAIATQLVTSASAPSQPTSAGVHQQVVYSSRVPPQRLVATTQQSGGQNLNNYSGPSSVAKLTNSTSNSESMQSIAQFQSTAVAYTTGGPSGPGRPPSVPVSTTQPQLYSTNTKTNPVIQVRHKVQMGSISQQQPGAGPQMSTASRRLKVEDALSYLDKVKYKFGDQPQVYNDFLDIMKEFKSESIDTPGVITRVSNLFNGHPELIEGFNTFLPPGYKIEVKPGDQGNAYQVSVSIPSPTQGTATVVHTTQGLSKGGLASPPMTGTQIQNSSHSQSATKQSGQVMQIIPSSAIIHTTMPSNISSVSGGAGGGGGSHSQSAMAAAAVTTPLPQSHQSVATIPQSSPVHLSTSTPVNMHHTSYASTVNSVATNVSQHSTSNNVRHIPQAQATVCQVLSQVETSHTNPQNQRVEFNHAINYVNKIKNRFQSQPDRYKRFLEILHTYQKEQRIMKESNSNIGGGNSGGGGGLSHADSVSASGGGSGVGKLTEAEVYSQVAKLFENQEDLLAEFGQFLPDATSNLSNKSLQNDSHVPKKTIIKSPYNNSIRDRERERERENREREREHRDREHRERETIERDREHRERDRDRNEHRERNSLPISQKYGHTSGQIKRSPPYNSQSMSPRDGGPPMKKHKVPSLRDVSLAEAGKYGTLHDYAFFDKVRKALRSQEVYDNFLRCLVLFNEEVISRSELVQLSGPFLGKFPELFKWFKDFIGHSDSGVEPIPNNVVRQERPQGDNALEVDLTTCKRLGASYCALPKTHTDSYGSLSTFPPGAQAHVGSLQGSRRCSGRTQLCREVLNDTWVSFPTWSEDSTFVTNRKTQFEEYIYRCEDERFELDVVIETNASTIRVLEGVWRRIQRFSPDELAHFRLDDTLGGTSAVLHQRALRRIYGDKAPDIVDGLKRNPGVAVQVVLRRLRAKEEEWREAQKNFNKIWREQNEKYYLKSLDHQGINFKQNDVKSLRSKSLFNEIETLYDERHEQQEEGATSAAIGAAPLSGPHLVLSYAAHVTPNSSVPANPVISGAALASGKIPRTGPIERSVLDDAAGLLIHHVRRQTGIQKQEKARIKALLRQFIPDLFHHPRQQLSDDERDDDDDRDDMEIESNSRSSPSNADSKSNPKSSSNSPRDNSRKTPPADSSTDDSKIPMDVDVKKEIDVENIKTEDDEKYIVGDGFEDDPDEYYTLFMANNHWYLFLRLHAVLCSRLATIHAHAQRLIAQEREERSKRKQSTAVALKLKPQPEYEVEQYYPAFLDMVKNVLDGNMDSNAYEDTLREMFGIHAYIAFTLDKVVSYAVRQLQHCATERGAIECCNMWLNERRKAHPSYNSPNNARRESLRDKDFFRNLSKDVYSLCRTNKNDSFANCYASGAGGACATAHRRKAAEIAYQRAAEAKLRDENCFKIYIYKNNLRVSIELLDTDSDEPDSQSALSEAQKRSNYIERFANDGIISTTSGGGVGGGSDGKTTNRLGGNCGGDNTSSGGQDLKNLTSDTKTNSCGAKEHGVSEKGTRKRFDRKLSTSEIKEEKNLSDQDESEHGNDLYGRSWSGRKATFLKRNLRHFRHTAQRNNLAKSSSTTSSDTSTSESVGVPIRVDDLQLQTSSDIHDNDDEMKELERKLTEKGIPQRMNSSVSSEFVVDDKTQCRFNLNSYKMVYIVNKESYLYKKDAFTKARECHPAVTKQLSARFKLWHKRWLSANVTEAQQKAACDWLMGRTEGLIANRTRVITNNDIRRTPYTTYNRYRVERLVPTSSDGDSG